MGVNSKRKTRAASWANMPMYIDFRTKKILEQEVPKRSVT